MRTYNLFRRTDRAELICAVPEDRPVPAFIRGPPWEFAARVGGAAISSLSFNYEAAEASVRYNGFYLFQIIDASNLQFRVDPDCAKDAVYEAPARDKGLRRENPMAPNRLMVAAERSTDRRPVRAQVQEEKGSDL